MSQDYVIEVPGQYPRRCVFRIFGEDRIKQFNLQMNEDVTVQFDIDAHEYQGRWFNDVRAYNIIRGQVPPPARRSRPPQPLPPHHSPQPQRLPPRAQPTTFPSNQYNSIY